MSKKADTASASHRRENLNRLAALLQTDAPHVVTALAANRVEWPRSAAAALEIQNLADPALSMLANIGWRIAEGDAVPPDWLRSLRQRVRRYHNVKV